MTWVYMTATARIWNLPRSNCYTAWETRLPAPTLSGFSLNSGAQKRGDYGTDSAGDSLEGAGVREEAVGRVV